MIKIVVLSLTVTDMYTGTLLYERMMDWDRFAVSGNHIEDCRVWAGEKPTRSLKNTNQNTLGHLQT